MSKGISVTSSLNGNLLLRVLVSSDRQLSLIMCPALWGEEGLQLVPELLVRM